MMNRKGKWAVLLSAALLAICAMLLPASAAEGDLYIFDEEIFPDVAFSLFIEKNYDKDKNDYLSLEERSAVTSMSLSNGGFESLKGIEYFPALKTLTANDNYLTELDLRCNTALTSLLCYNNELKSLDVRGCTELTTISCYTNQLTTLDVSTNTKLNYLRCYNNKLISLDVSACNALKGLYCYNNQLNLLTLGQKMDLVRIECNDNQLSSLDVSRCLHLDMLHCEYNRLTSLKVNSGSYLQGLYCNNNNLTELDVSRCSGLISLYCGSNFLTSMDFTKVLSITTWRASPQTYSISPTGDLFDLSTLPGEFDVTRLSSLNGGTVDGNTLNINSGITSVSYKYNVGTLGASSPRLDAYLSVTLTIDRTAPGTPLPPTGDLVIESLALPASFTGTPVVSLTSTTGAAAATMTTANGAYGFDCAASGEYLLTIEGEGLNPFRMKLDISTAAPTVIPEITLTRRGDMDGNGTVTARDVNLLLAALVAMP